MRQRRCKATASESNSSKVYRRIGYLAAVQIKPVKFTLFRCTSAELFISCCGHGVAGSGLGTTIKYLRRTASGAADYGPGTLIKHLRRKTRQRSGHHGQVPATRNERRRRQRPGHHGQVPAARNERRRRQRPGHHGQVPAMHNERRSGQRPWPLSGITNLPIHLKRPVFTSFCACLRRQQAE
jgi:hypothetical protein